MKSIIKIYTLIFVCLFVVFSACTEKVDYDPAVQPTNEQVYFSNSLPAKVELSSVASFFTVEIKRIKTTDALSVPLTSTQATDKFTIPASVEFKAGEENAFIAITYNAETFTYDDYIAISLTIDNSELTSDYGSTLYAFAAGVPAPWKSIGKALFKDKFIFGFDNAYEVEIEQNQVETNRYRLVAPYQKGFEILKAKPTERVSPFVEFTILPKGSVYKGVTTTIEGLVVFPIYNTGDYESTVKADILSVHPSNFPSMATEAFWTYNSVIQASDDGEPEIVQFAPYYYLDGDGRGWDYTQENNMITIAFPGVELKDYAIDLAYAGKFTDPEGKQSAMINVAMGADLTSSKTAWIFYTEGTLDDLIDGVLDGSIESQELSESGTLHFPSAVSGYYIGLTLGFDGDELKSYEFIEEDFNATRASANLKLQKNKLAISNKKFTALVK